MICDIHDKLQDPRWSGPASQRRPALGDQAKGSRVTAETESNARARRALIEAIVEEVRETASWTGVSHLSARVLAALDSVPRHLFVPEEERRWAYENRPLPIGQGQTISQPYIVAIMTELAALEPEDRVLEVGTGCGYQGAVLAEVADQVISIESLPGLAAEAAERLAALGYTKVQVRQGDGALGWPEAAPFDAILVTAAAEQAVPPALVEQLAPGGRLVIPVGASRRSLLGRFGLGPEQELRLLVKDEAGAVTERAVLPVAFVPLIESG